MNGRGKRAPLAAAAAALAGLVAASFAGTAANATIRTQAAPTAAPAVSMYVIPGTRLRLPQVKLNRKLTRYPAVERRAGIVPQLHGAPGSHSGIRPDASNLLYNGGPVAHTARLYLLFWGTQWSSDPNGVESYLYNYTHGICSGGDNWVSVTFQYNDSSGAGPTCNNGSAFQGWAQDVSGPAPANASQAQIAAEGVVGADYFGALGTDAQVAVLSPSGTHPDGFPNTGFCAWHSDTFDPSGNEVSYTNMPYVLDAGGGCGENIVQGPLDGFSIVEGHEFAETQTDPELNAWIDSSGEEIGDKCAWTNLFVQSTPWGSFAQQPLWDNSSGSCQP
ncbi:MAG TPA: hypothetical protein VGI31_00985 [Streptosporangiaceae bacterium]